MKKLCDSFHLTQSKFAPDRKLRSNLQSGYNPE